MSNLSDLLPAGAAAKQLTFTDSGSGIATKKPVVLNSDGTVTEVGNASASFGSAQAFATGNYGSPASAYDPDNDRVCTVYIDADNSYYGTAVVGQISGSSITWGTPLFFESAYTPYPDIDYDTGTNQFVISFVDGTASNFLGVKTAAYAATNSLTFGSKVNGPEYAGGTSIACSSSAFLIVYDGLYGTGIAGTISGTTITLGTEVDYIAGSSYNTRGSTVVYDSNAGKYLISTADGNNSFNGYNFVTTVTGTSISYGSGTVFDPHAINNTNAVYDSTAQKTVIVYVDLTFSNVQGVVATISGTSVSFGTVYQVIDTNSIGWQLGRQITYDARSNKTYISYTRNSDGYAYILTGTVSGTDITLSDETAYTSASTGELTIVTDTTNNKVGLFYKDMSSTNDGTSKVYSPAGTNLTAQAFVGVADSAISASAAGSVIVQGGTVSGVSSGTGLSLGTAAEVDGTGNSVPQGIVYDSNENKIVVVFQDAGASYSGAAAVGTVSGTSISFGTPVSFDADGIYYAVACFDSSNNKVVIAYADTGNSSYLTAIVGTVSGTSISYGSPVVVESSNAADYKGIAYDANAQKVVIGWRDAGNSNYGSAIVGTVSGTSISFGTKAAFNSAAANVYGVTYDANAQKVVFSYRDDGTGSGYGRSIVGTVSGTGISFGSATTFDANSYSNNISSGYDSTNNKVIVVFRDQGNSNYGTARVGTVSGTSISFGTAAVFNAENTQGMSGGCVAEDVNAQKIIIAGDGPSGGMVVSGTVSGTDITFDTPITTDVGASENKLIYDSSSNKVVLTYQAESDSYKCVARMTTYGDLPLTTGTKYYVTTSGGFSSSADTPSVNAGLAISTTSLLLNGDS